MLRASSRGAHVTARAAAAAAVGDVSSIASMQPASVTQGGRGLADAYATTDLAAPQGAAASARYERLGALVGARLRTTKGAR